MVFPSKDRAVFTILVQVQFQSQKIAHFPKFNSKKPYSNIFSKLIKLIKPIITQKIPENKIKIAKWIESTWFYSIIESSFYWIQFPNFHDQFDLLICAVHYELFEYFLDKAFKDKRENKRWILKFRNKIFVKRLFLINIIFGWK